jgi:hypothetical protein
MTPFKQEYREKVICEYEEERIRRGVEFGECFCGCKQKTRVATRSSALYQNIKGLPVRFLPLHHNKQRQTTILDRTIYQNDRGMDYCLIPLTRGQFAQVSPHRLDQVAQRKWYAIWQDNTQSFYAGCKGKYTDGRRGIIFMHRFILGLELDDPRTGDHEISSETLNNTDDNLRIATYGQQASNKSRPRTSTTGFKGVFLRKENGMYKSHIGSNRKKYALGQYAEAEVAARIYDLAAIRLHGEFASLNFPRSDYRTAD